MQSWLTQLCCKVFWFLYCCKVKVFWIWFKQYLFRDNWETIQVLYKSLLSWALLACCVARECIECSWLARVTVPPACHKRRKVQLASGKRDMTSRLLSPLADDCRRFFALKYAKLLNNHCVLLGIIVCTTITGISSFYSCDLHHSACTHFGIKWAQLKR